MSNYPPNVVLSTRTYEFEHGRKPRGRGRWFFRNEVTGEVVNPQGEAGRLLTLSEAAAHLPAGSWSVQP